MFQVNDKVLVLYDEILLDAIVVNVHDDIATFALDLFDHWEIFHVSEWAIEFHAKLGNPLVTHFHNGYCFEEIFPQYPLHPVEFHPLMVWE